MSRHTRNISLVVATLLGAVLLFFSLRGIEWRQVWRTIAGANLWALTATSGHRQTT